MGLVSFSHHELQCGTHEKARTFGKQIKVALNAPGFLRAGELAEIRGTDREALDSFSKWKYDIFLKNLNVQAKEEKQK